MQNQMESGCVSLTILNSQSFERWDYGVTHHTQVTRPFLKITAVTAAWKPPGSRLLKPCLPESQHRPAGRSSAGER